MPPSVVSLLFLHSKLQHDQLKKEEAPILNPQCTDCCLVGSQHYCFAAGRLCHKSTASPPALSKLPTTDDSSLLSHPSVCQKSRKKTAQYETKKHSKGKKMEAAVVTASHGAMASILEKLCYLLTDKFSLLKGTKEQIVFLKDELQNMYVFLKKMSDTEEPDEQDKCWAKEIRELSYDIEDSINDFLHRVEHEANSQPHGFTGFIKRMMNLLKTINTRHEIAEEFQGLKRRVMEVSERRTRYKIDDSVSKPNNTRIDLRLLAMYAQSAGLVGTDGPRDELIQLMDGEGVPAYQLKVVSIVGFGGLGKTTLANQVYHKLKREFQCTTFVSVSQKPNIRKILRTILYHVRFENTSSIETWEDHDLISALRNFLSDKRYFIVIDDIWDASAWHVIRCALPENNNGSRVITTTRIETVARSCCDNKSEYVYKMKPLSDQDSRSLFLKRIFGSEDACPPYLEEVSDGILRKCGGLPLAIITVSSLLASRPTNLKEHWEYVRNSIGSNFEVSPSLEGMRQILNLSYINLPHCLKTCMLYLGIYPEDRTIRRNDLVRQWMAEGFISKSLGINPEDVARSYFNELINRSMIQPVDTNRFGEVKSCRVHDMMLDLILHNSKEENFITVIDDIQHIRQHDIIRRLSLLDGTIGDTGLGSIQLPRIRTLAIFRTSLYFPHFILFKHLRVLTVEILAPYVRSELLDLSGICHLFQLRYIKIVSQHHRVVLPSKIVGLQLLETLHLKCNSLQSPQGEYLEKLPTYIVQLGRLLHLIIEQTTFLTTELPDGIGKMKSLRTLHSPCFLMGSLDNMKGLRELANLTDLKIGCFESSLSSDELAQRVTEVIRSCLEDLHNLKYLRIHCSWPHCIDGCCIDVVCSVSAFSTLRRLHMSDGFWFSRVPEWICQLHSLYDLVLHVKEVLEDGVGMISQLPSLIFLSLNISGFREYPKDRIIIRGSGFPVLKRFTVTCCNARISQLTFEEGAMPKLEKLKLCFNALEWDRYGAAPCGIKHLSGLQKFSASIGSSDAKESEVEAAESAMQKAIDMHPGGPAAKIRSFNGGFLQFDYYEPTEVEPS